MKKSDDFERFKEQLKRDWVEIEKRMRNHVLLIDLVHPKADDTGQMRSERIAMEWLHPARARQLKKRGLIRNVAKPGRPPVFVHVAQLEYLSAQIIPIADIISVLTKAA